MRKSNRIFLLITLFHLQISSLAQSKPFLLNGTLKGIQNGSIAIHLIDDNNQKFQLVKEAIVKKEKFQFTGTIPFPFKAYFIINDSLSTSEFYIDYGKQEIFLNIDSLQNEIKITGSKSNQEYINNYKKQINPFDHSMDNWYNDYWQLLAKYNQKLPVEIEDSMQQISNSIIYKIDSVNLHYIKRNPLSYVGFWEIYQKIYNNGYRPIFDSSFRLLDRRLKSSSSGIFIKKLLEGGKQIQIGNKFPFFECVDSSGSVINNYNSKLKQFTLIDFWFSYCSPCISQFNGLKKIYAEYKGKGFEILSISVDKKENKMNWENVLNKYQLEWPQYWDQDQKQSSKLAINIFPTNFLLDKNGKIIAKNLMPNQLSYFLSKHL